MRCFQISLVFLSFLIIFYWILEIAKVQFADFIVQFFDLIKNSVHLFYTRTVTIDQITIDFSFLIAVLIFLVLVWLLNYCAEGLTLLEEKYDKLHRYIKGKNEESFNVKLERTNKGLDKKPKKILVLIKFSATDLSKDSFFVNDANHNSEEKEKEAVIELWEILTDSLKFKETFLEKTLLLYFQHFEEADNVLVQIENAIKEVKSEFLKNNWKLHHFVSIDVYSSESEIVLKAKKLKTLLNFNYEDAITCFATFGQKYSELRDTKHSMNVKGVYKIDEDEEEIFEIKPIT